VDKKVVETVCKNYFGLLVQNNANKSKTAKKVKLKFSRSLVVFFLPCYCVCG